MSPELVAVIDTWGPWTLGIGPFIVYSLYEICQSFFNEPWKACELIEEKCLAASADSKGEEGARFKEFELHTGDRFRYFEKDGAVYRQLNGGVARRLAYHQYDTEKENAKTIAALIPPYLLTTAIDRSENFNKLLRFDLNSPHTKDEDLKTCLLNFLTEINKDDPHLDVPDARAKEIVALIQTRLPKNAPRITESEIWALHDDIYNALKRTSYKSLEEFERHCNYQVSQSLRETNNSYFFEPFQLFLKFYKLWHPDLHLLMTKVALHASVRDCNSKFIMKDDTLREAIKYVYGCTDHDLTEVNRLLPGGGVAGTDFLERCIARVNPSLNQQRQNLYVNINEEVI